MDLPTVTVADAATVIGCAFLVMLLLEAIKRATNFKEELVKRFSPAVGILLGVVIASLAAWYKQLDPGEAVVTGLIAGGFSGGLYDNITSFWALWKKSPAR